MIRSSVIFRAFSYILLAIALFTLARAILPGIFIDMIADTAFGRFVDQIGQYLQDTLLREGTPLVRLLGVADSGVGYLRATITSTNLLSAALGAVGVGIFNIGYNWLRNLGIRRTCSAMLYSSGLRIRFNVGIIYSSFTRNGKPFRDSLDGSATKTLVLNNNKDVRAALHRLRCEMETLQDFAIAYDYAIWRGLRHLTAKVRIRSMAVREALEVVVAELELSKEGENLDFRPARLGVKAATTDGYDALDLTDALSPVLNVSIELAECLEVGFVRSFFLWWWPASGSSLPKGAPKLRAQVRELLIKWRHTYWQREAADKDSWETWWVAAADSEPIPQLNNEIRQVLRRAA